MKDSFSTGQHPRRGRLKLFLGYAVGVGTTYAMLESARQRHDEGSDIVVGVIDAHPQSATLKLMKGLESMADGGINSEMDVDAILSRRPHIVVVDELAHTNAPGSRHPRRYQDVEELLEAGIDVYATVNIQHFESLKDIVAQITGVIVTDTIPDSFLEKADAIELIDLPPDELIKRFQDEAIRNPAWAETWRSPFFRKGNLTALRELAMRRAAGRVDVQMRDYMQAKDIHGPWAASERLLVCVSSHPHGEKLVRAGYRLAKELDASWYVLHVQTPGNARQDTQQHDQRIKTLNLAEKLGAHTETCIAHSVSAAVVQYAQNHNITKVIVGRPVSPRWYEFFHNSIVDEIIRQGQSLDIYVISGETYRTKPMELGDWKPRSPFLNYLRSAGLVFLVSLLGFPLQAYIHSTNMVMFYLAVVIIAAIFLGRGPSILASFLSFLIFDFFFIDPRLSLTVADTEYLVTLFGFLAISLVVSNLASTVREQVRQSQEREAQTAALNALSRDLAIALDLKDMLRAVIEHVSQALSRDAAILIPDEGSALKLQASTPNFSMAEGEMAVARWAFEHAQPAGRGTETYPETRMRCLPLRTSSGVVGILCIEPLQPTSFLTQSQRALLEGFANLAALAIERARLSEQANRAQVLSASEKLQTALLNSISHDLRTPLVSIKGVLDSLYDVEQGGADSVRLDRSTRLDLIENARDEAQRLNRLVENLLDMTRLEAGTLKLSRDESDIQDVVGSALAYLDDHLRNNPVQVRIVPDLPLIPIDFVLIEQVLINILDNAVKYSAPGSPIDIDVRLDTSFIRIGVADRGIGIPDKDLEQVFEKFYRVRRSDGAKGTGLGLSICRGIVEAHGGKIWAQNRPAGGTEMIITLPMGLQEKSVLTGEQP